MKPPRRRSPIRKIGSRGKAWIETRQRFLKMLLDGRERASFPCGMRIAVDGIRYGDIAFAAGGGVTVWIEPGLAPYPRYVSDGHLHHIMARSRRPDLRTDITNLVLLTAAKHQEIESRYRKGG